MRAIFMTPKVWIPLLSRRCSSQSGLTSVVEKDGVRCITLQNPKKRNALSSAMLEKLGNDLFSNINDVTLRCIVLQSTGPVFSSGHDLKELSASGQQSSEVIFKKCADLMVGIRDIPVPVIGVVNGLAAAAGCQLVASCDITISTSRSQFSTPGASVGLFCSTPGVAVSRNVPLKVASYMLLTGNNLTANEALHCGLVSKVVEENELEIEIEKTIKSILAKSRTVLALGKKFFYQQLNMDIKEAYSVGSGVMVDNLAHPEAKEGIAAFFEKRHPNWQHE